MKEGIVFMERRKIGSKTTVATGFADYSYMLNGIAGIGKTTTAVEIGQKLYGEDGVLLLTVGEEPKPEHMGNVLNEVAKDWKDFSEIIKLLVKYKKEDYPELRMVAMDTTNEIFRIAEDYMVSEYNNANPTKKVASIKAAYGGFQAGENLVVDLVIRTIFPLRNAGICPFFIGHTKKKNIKDPQTDIEYEVTTSDLDSKYYNAIKDRVAIVGCAYVEREMNDIQTVKDAFTKKDKKVGRIQSEKRVLAFRDEEHAIDNKSHLKFIDAKVDFTTDSFIKAIEDAIQKQVDFYAKPVSDTKEVTPVSKKEVAPIEETIEDILIEDDVKEELVVDKAKNEELKNKIAAIMKDLAKAGDKTKFSGIKKIFADYNAEKLDTDKPTEMFVKVLEYLQ